MIMNRSSFAKGVAAIVAGALALGAGGVAAQAQPYGQYGYYGNNPGYGSGYGYDPCQRDANGRGIAGALVGGGMGAVIGSQVSANHHRSDGSLVGGLLGALVGAGVGKSSAACNQAPPPPGPPLPPGPPPPPPPAAYNSYGDDGYRYDGAAYDEQGWAYGRQGQRFRIAAGRVGPDGCTLAESPIYLPDGRIQKRFVRVCMDGDGRYQVVD
jgi:hypothetical protein